MYVFFGPVVVVHLQHQRIGHLAMPRDCPGRRVGVHFLRRAGQSQHGGTPACTPVDRLEFAPVAVLKAAFAFFHGEPPCCQLRPRRRCRRAVEVVAEAEGASLGEVFGAEIAAVANELTVEDVVAIAHVYATGVEPQPGGSEPGAAAQQVVVDVHVAGALIEIDQSQGADPHTEDVVTIVQHVIGDLRARPFSVPPLEK